MQAHLTGEDDENKKKKRWVLTHKNGIFALLLKIKEHSDERIDRIVGIMADIEDSSLT